VKIVLAALTIFVCSAAAADDMFVRAERLPAAAFYFQMPVGARATQRVAHVGFGLERLAPVQLGFHRFAPTAVASLVDFRLGARRGGAATDGLGFDSGDSGDSSWSGCFGPGHPGCKAAVIGGGAAFLACLVKAGLCDNGNGSGSGTYGY